LGDTGEFKEGLLSFSKTLPFRRGMGNIGKSKRGEASLKKSLPPLLPKERGT